MFRLDIEQEEYNHDENYISPATYRTGLVVTHIPNEGATTVLKLRGMTEACMNQREFLECAWGPGHWNEDVRRFIEAMENEGGVVQIRPDIEYCDTTKPRESMAKGWVTKIVQAEMLVFESW